MDVQELAAGLWRWTAQHPSWDDPPLPREVGSVYAETADAVVLIDPLVPPDEEQRFFEALDRDVQRLGLPVAILLTVQWHERSAPELRARYPAHGGEPDGVVAQQLLDDEVAYWLPRYRTLVSGDALLGIDGLRRCPDAWTEGRGGERFLPALRSLLDLGVELVLPAHGDPVLANATQALELAIEGPAYGD
jgi:glyoxylase-like metal-dependent hydrolase (beta-lactamase superfamily II)